MDLIFMDGPACIWPYRPKQLGAHCRPTLPGFVSQSEYPCGAGFGPSGAMLALAYLRVPTNLSLDRVKKIALLTLRRAGASALQAGAVARSIRATEAERTRGIGLGYLQWYCLRLRVGKIISDVAPKVAQPRAGVVTADAKRGLAHHAYEAGEDALIAAARAQGIAVLGVANGYACGVLGSFSDRLARAGLVSITFTNASLTMAPGAARRRSLARTHGSLVPRARAISW
jgi:hypothetical protein